MGQDRYGSAREEGAAAVWTRGGTGVWEECGAEVDAGWDGRGSVEGADNTAGAGKGRCCRGDMATGWSLPALRYLSVHCGTQYVDLPDILAFLPVHGAPLLFLDLYSISATVAFNADWRLVHTNDEDVEPRLVYERLTNVGLHGLVYAFSVGFAVTHMQGDPVPMFLVTSANDRTLAALCTRKRFPVLLHRVCVLSHSLLEEFDRADRPAEAMAQWEACNHAGDAVVEHAAPADRGGRAGPRGRVPRALHMLFESPPSKRNEALFA
ncbi:hypothetical protein B0H14DRAFT_3476025 [Mycena olivaceomarginata]|nr:hypothetical protein B0H14DRAFT_3476025 [Mycena olivaceomarginata]